MTLASESVMRCATESSKKSDRSATAIWLLTDLTTKPRARARAKEKGLPANQRTAPGRLVEGGLVNGWKQALGALVLHYPDRLAPYIN